MPIPLTPSRCGLDQKLPHESLSWLIGVSLDLGKNQSATFWGNFHQLHCFIECHVPGPDFGNDLWGFSVDGFHIFDVGRVRLSDPSSELTGLAGRGCQLIGDLSATTWRQPLPILGFCFEHRQKFERHHGPLAGRQVTTHEVQCDYQRQR